MILDIVQTIINYSGNLADQLCCMQIDSHLYNNIYIYQLDAHFGHDMYHITQNVINQKKFCELKYLNCNGNSHIKNVNHLAKTLEILYCGYIEDKMSGIDQKGISELEKIKVLNCSLNNKITDVNHLSKTLVSLSGQPCTCMC